LIASTAILRSEPDAAEWHRSSIPALVADGEFAQVCERPAGGGEGGGKTVELGSRWQGLQTR
jgi:hypothetical protein